MSLAELKDKGDKYKELIEARDLEDILYKWRLIINNACCFYLYRSLSST